MPLVRYSPLLDGETVYRSPGTATARRHYSMAPLPHHPTSAIRLPAIRLRDTTQLHNTTPEMNPPRNGARLYVPNKIRSSTDRPLYHRRTHTSPRSRHTPILDRTQPSQFKILNCESTGTNHRFRWNRTHPPNLYISPQMHTFVSVLPDTHPIRQSFLLNSQCLSHLRG